MAYTFLAAQGHQVGDSLLEADQIPQVSAVLAEAASAGVEVVLPVDHVVVSEIAAGAAEVERFDTDAISHQDQTFLRPDPNRKCKHPTQSFKTFDAPFTKSM